MSALEVVNDHNSGADTAALIVARDYKAARRAMIDGLTQTQASIKSLNTALVLYVEHGYPDLTAAMLKVRRLMQGLTEP